VGVGEVRVWVRATKVGEGDGVLDGFVGETEFGEENGAGVGSGDAIEAVEEDGEGGVGGEEVLDEGKVEDVAEEDDIVFDGVDDRNFAGSVGKFADLGEVNLRGELGIIQHIAGRLHTSGASNVL